VTVLSTIFILFDSINAAYWLLSDLCAQMALMVYVIMFAAAIKLRYTHPDHPRSYKIPGGNKVMWFISSVGILCCLAAMLVGFIPPAQIPINDVFLFELFLVGGLVLFVVIPWFFTKKLLRA
jgi:amino acid transporter